MNDFTVDNIIDVLAGYIEPIAGKCLQAQANRVPMPKDQFCILTPLRFTRLSTTRELKQDTGSPDTSTMGYTEVRQADIQVDIYGQGAGDRAIALETTFTSGYGYDIIKLLMHACAALLISCHSGSDDQRRESVAGALHVNSFPASTHHRVVPAGLFRQSRNFN